MRRFTTIPVCATKGPATVAAAALCLSFAGAGQAATPIGKAASADAQLHEAWRTSIAQTPTPQAGCFKASYPSTVWTPVTCKTAPKRPYLPRGGHRGYTVGNGNDYAAVVSGLISSGVGTFPVVTGLKSETGYGGQANTYSLQLNSDFFTTSVCNGSSDPQDCAGWEQFVYSNSGVAFIQYWLLDYGSKCPSGGWMEYEGSCYRNSNGVDVPTQVITQLGNLKLSGTAVSGGLDTLTMTTASNAYSTTGNDSVVYLAKGWNQAEFNVVGDGGGSEAKFNKGTSLTVDIALKDGSSSAPTCESDDGTTGETNNLTLGSCSTGGGSTPYVKFTEKN
jgi:hypothetical protein